jgi:hypothetical protein
MLLRLLLCNAAYLHVMMNQNVLCILVMAVQKSRSLKSECSVTNSFMSKQSPS